MYEPIKAKCINPECKDYNKVVAVTLEGIFFDEYGKFHKDYKDCKTCLQSSLEILNEEKKSLPEFNMKYGIAKEIKIIR